MTKFVKLFKSKPYIFFIALSVVAIIAISAIFISPKATSKDSSSEIQCIYNVEEFRSGKNANGNYEKYDITFSTPMGFKSPIIEYSYNITNVSITKSSLVQISFEIAQGTNFWFNISSQNYQTKKFYFEASPYIQSLNMRYELVDRDNRSYSLKNDGTYNILYKTSTLNFNQAILDRLPSQVNFSVFSNAKAIEDRYQLSVSNTQILEVKNNTITPKEIGLCSIKISATDGSGYSDTLKFKVEKMPAISIYNLPNNVTLTKADGYKKQLTGFSVYPSYTDLSFFDFADDIVELKNMTISARKPGTTEIVFVNNKNEIQHKMLVIVTSEDNFQDNNNGNNNQNTEKFIIAIGEHSANFNYNNTTKTFTLKLSDFNGDKPILNILISVDTEEPITTAFTFSQSSITDPNSIIHKTDSLLNNIGLKFTLNKIIGTASFIIQNPDLEIGEVEIFIVICE